MPKSLLSLVLALTLSLSFIPSAFAQDLTALSNADILIMVRAKLPSTLIVEKINTSNCNFDTFPSVLAELKHKGVTDEVLMAMVQGSARFSKKWTFSSKPHFRGRGYRGHQCSHDPRWHAPGDRSGLHRLFSRR